jgi:hypothetical protein
VLIVVLGRMVDSPKKRNGDGGRKTPKEVREVAVVRALPMSLSKFNCVFILLLWY